MLCSFYLRKGSVFVPTMAKTEAGYWLAVEPVEVRKVPSVDVLKVILLAVIARGNPVVPTPTRVDFPPPVMERYCGMKSLPAFERTATCWAVSRERGEYKICEWRRSERYRGAREEASETRILLPLSTTLEEVLHQAAEFALSAR
jgi:hypothetical protein